MPVKRVLCLIAVVIAGILVSAPSAQAAGLTSPYTELTIDSSGPSADIQGNLTFDSNNASLNEFSQTTGRVVVNVTSALRNFYSIDVTPPSGAAWTVGTTYSASNTPTATQASFIVDGQEACSVQNATLTVQQATVDANGNVTAFAASYASTCDSATTVLTGDVRYNSTIGYVDSSSDVASIDPCCQFVGETGTAMPITFTGAGSTPTQYGQAVIAGTTPGAFQISADTCSKKSLAYDATCEVDVEAHPTALADQTATLTLPDNSSGGGKSIALNVTGLDPHAVTATPTSFNGSFNVDQAGAAETVKITPSGSQPVTFGTATLSGATSAYSISANTCSAKTITLVQSCSVTVIPHPTAAGNVAATLTVPDNSLTGPVVVSLAGTAFAGTAGEFTPVTTRLVDTQTGVGASGALGAGKTLKIPVLTGGQIPTTGVSAVVLNVTGVAPSASTYLTAYPDGTTQPTASNLNLPAGRTVSNMVTVKVGADGYVDLYNHAGSLQVVVDAEGFYDSGTATVLAAGNYRPITPTRALDTRTAAGGGALQAHQEIAVPLNFGASVNSHVKAVAINLTAVGSVGSGSLSTNINPTSSSTLAFTKGATVPNMAIVPVFNCSTLFPTCASVPAITVYNSSSSTVNVLVDVIGIYDNATLPGGSRFFPVNPTRIVDTRTDLGAKPLTSGGTATVTTPSSVLSSATGFYQPTYSGLDLNVTAVAPTTSTYITVWANGITRPTASNLNAVAAQTVPNSVFTGIDAAHKFLVFNHAGTANVVVDVAGVFEPDPLSGTATPIVLAPGTPVRHTVK